MLIEISFYISDISQFFSKLSIKWVTISIKYINYLLFEYEKLLEMPMFLLVSIMRIIINNNNFNIVCSITALNIKHLILGAFINIICTSGRTPLGVAAEMGNTTILKKLLESCSVHGLHSPETEQQPQKKYRSKKCRREMSESRVCGGSNIPGNVCGTIKGMDEGDIATSKGANLGYFIMVHKEGATNTDENRNKSSESTIPSASEVRTPEGMDGLEWDTEVIEDSSETVDDSWASLYRWYADILDRTGSLLQKPHQSDFNHQDIYGRCAVHYAAEQGHIEALRMLRAAGY